MSRTSIDSISSGGEFVVVQAEPRLRIPGNGDTVDLEKKLSEVCVAQPKHSEKEFLL